MAVEHLELPLHHLFSDRVIPLENFALPDDLQPSWLTPRTIQLLHLQNALKTLHDNFPLTKAFCDQILGLPQLQDYSGSSVQRAFLRLAATWRIANGVFVKSEVKVTADTFEKTMEVAIKFTDDQWFFGTIFNVDKGTWTMSPSADKLLTPQQAQALEHVLAPQYPLPKPQDVDQTFRDALEERGRKLPSFESWLGENYIHFPAHLQNDVAVSFGIRPQQGRVTRRSDPNSARITAIAPIIDDNGDDDYVPPIAGRPTRQQVNKKRPIDGAIQPSAKRHQVAATHNGQTHGTTTRPVIANTQASNASATSSSLDLPDATIHVAPNRQTKQNHIQGPQGVPRQPTSPPRAHHAALPTRLSPHPTPQPKPHPKPGPSLGGTDSPQSRPDAGNSAPPIKDQGHQQFHQARATGHAVAQKPPPSAHAITSTPAPAPDQAGPAYDTAQSSAQPIARAQHSSQARPFPQAQYPGQARPQAPVFDQAQRSGQIPPQARALTQDERSVQHQSQFQAQAFVQPQRPLQTQTDPQARPPFVNAATSAEAAFDSAIALDRAMHKIAKAHPGGFFKQYSMETDHANYEVKVILMKKN